MSLAANEGLAMQVCLQVVLVFLFFALVRLTAKALELHFSCLRDDDQNSVKMADFVKNSLA